MLMKQFKFLVTCAECGSYGKASRILFTTQANITKTIKQLEDEVGYPVFIRTGSGVSLTLSGKELYEQAIQILNIVENIKKGDSITNKESLLISSNPSNILSKLFVDFVEENQAKIGRSVFNEFGTIDVLENVEQENTDIGFVYIEKKQKSIFPEILKKNHLHFIPIAEAHLVLSVGQKNPLYRERQISLKMLKEQKYYKMCEDLFTREYHLHQMIAELGLQKNMAEAICTNSDHVARHLLEETNRVNLSYSFSTKLDLLADIREINLEHLLKKNNNKILLGYVVKKDKRINSISKEFIDKVSSTINASDCYE